MANIWRWTVEGTDAAGQQLWQSTMHYQTDMDAASTEPDAATVLAKLVNHYGSGGNGNGMERWLVTIPPPVKLTHARVYQELAPGSTSVPGTADMAFTLSGQAASGTYLEPFALCPWIAFKTGLASRSSRGGTHLAPSVASYSLAAGGLYDTTTAWWSAIVALAGYQKDVLQAVFNGTIFGAGDLKPVIYSRTRRGRNQTPFTFQITSAIPSSKPRFVRRRDIGR